MAKAAEEAVHPHAERISKVFMTSAENREWLANVIIQATVASNAGPSLRMNNIEEKMEAQGAAMHLQQQQITDHDRKINEQNRRIAQQDIEIRNVRQLLENRPAHEQNPQQFDPQQFVFSQGGNAQHRARSMPRTREEWVAAGGAPLFGRPSFNQPISERVEFYMGNVGWNDDKTVREARAREVLSAAGIENIVNLRARSMLGSAVELEFATNSEGWTAAEKVRLLKRSYVNHSIKGTPTVVYITVLKNPIERMPGRLTQAALSVMEDKIRPETNAPWANLPMKADMEGKMLWSMAPKECLGYSRRGSWFWTKHPIMKWGKEELDRALNDKLNEG